MSNPIVRCPARCPCPAACLPALAVGAALLLHAGACGAQAERGVAATVTGGAVSGSTQAERTALRRLRGLLESPGFTPEGWIQAAGDHLAGRQSAEPAVGAEGRMGNGGASSDSVRFAEDMLARIEGMTLSPSERELALIEAELAMAYALSWGFEPGDRLTYLNEVNRLNEGLLREAEHRRRLLRSERVGPPSDSRAASRHAARAELLNLGLEDRVALLEEKMLEDRFSSGESETRQPNP